MWLPGCRDVDWPVKLQPSWHPICCPIDQDPYEKGSTLKGKNLLPLGANSFLLEQTPFQKGAKTIDSCLTWMRIAGEIHVPYLSLIFGHLLTVQLEQKRAKQLTELSNLNVYQFPLRLVKFMCRIYPKYLDSYLPCNCAGLGGSVGCAVRLETRRLWVQPPPRSATFFMEIDHEILSMVILSLPLIQEGQLSISDKRMCTILVNRFED